MFTSAHHSFVQNDTEKSRVYLQAAVVLDDWLPEEAVGESQMLMERMQLVRDAY